MCWRGGLRQASDSNYDGVYGHFLSEVDQNEARE